MLEFVGIALLSLLGLIAVLFAHAYMSYSAERSVVYAKETVRVDAARRGVTGLFAGVVSDLLVLADAENLEELIEDGGSDARERLSRDFTRFAERKRIYERIRYIDMHGVEVVRVDFDGQNAVRAPGPEPEDVRQRQYVLQTFGLPRGTVSVSPFSLNLEHESVRRPATPVINFGTPVFDRRGVKKGIIVVAMYASRLINEIQAQLSGTAGEMMLLNSKSHWLLASRPEDQWGFAYDRGRMFSGRYAEAWSQMLGVESGQFRDANGLFTFATVFPQAEAQRVSTAPWKSPGVGTNHGTHGQDFWKVLTRVPSEFFDGLIREFLIANLPAYFAIFILMAVGSALLAHSRTVARHSQESLMLSAKVVEATVEAVMATDAKERIIDVNPAFTTLTGYSAEEVVGDTPRVLKSGKHDYAFYENMRKTVNDKGSWQGEMWNRRKDGKNFLSRIHISAISDKKGHITNYFSIFSDITEEKRAEEELERMALHDNLTGLPNRNLLHDRLSQGLANARRNQEKMAVLFIDLDDFKQINDTLGHEAGDVALAEVSRRLRNSVRASDTVARIGGDEFVVILQEADDREGVTGMINKIQNAVSRSIVLDDHAFTLGASVGICLYPDDASDIDDLINFADAAMYRAKNAGPNAYEFYEESEYA